MPKHQSSSTRSPGQRQLKVGEQIRHTLSGILIRGELHEPVLDGVSVTVSEVRISPDLKNATAFIMPLGGNRREEVHEALIRAAPELRRLVAREMILRYAPRISFRIDESYDVASHIDSLLRRPEVVRDLKPSEDGE